MAGDNARRITARNIEMSEDIRIIEHGGMRMTAKVKRISGRCEELTILHQERVPRGHAAFAGPPANAPVKPAAPKPEMPVQQIAAHRRALREYGLQAYEDLAFNVEKARAKEKAGGAPISATYLRDIRDKELKRLREYGAAHVAGLTGVDEWRETLISAATKEFAWRFDYYILPEKASWGKGVRA
jgi:hypothetical protein